jgi:kynurenine 3-monooxygenase
MSEYTKQKVVVVGAGPVGALAALYAAGRGDDVEVYELRNGRVLISS